MGAAHSGSPRTSTIENPTGLVNITDDVVKRLKGQRARNDELNRNETNSNIGGGGDDGSHPLMNGSSTPSSYGNPPQQPPPAIYYAEPTITALSVRRQKEQELRNNDAYWRMRMEQQEKTLQKTNAILEKEYDAAIENVRNRFQNASPQHQLPPCREYKAKLIDCYNKHPNETLRCGQLVSEFTDCVARHRTKLLDDKATIGTRTATGSGKESSSMQLDYKAAKGGQ